MVVEGRRLGVEPIVRVLREAGLTVAPSTFHATKTRPASVRSVRGGGLRLALRSPEEGNHRVYGTQRLLSARRAGHAVGWDRVARLMRAEGLESVLRTKRVRTTRTDPTGARQPDLVQRQFTAEAPNQLWGTDLAYVPTWAGVAYVCSVIDWGHPLWWTKAGRSWAGGSRRPCAPTPSWTPSRWPAVPRHPTHRPALPLRCREPCQRRPKVDPLATSNPPVARGSVLGVVDTPVDLRALDILDTAQGSVELGVSVKTFAHTAAAQARAD